MQKMYHIGKTYSSSIFSKVAVERLKIAPKSENHACFALTSPCNKPRSEIQTLSQMSDEELMLEVEMLRVCDAAFKNSKLAQRYELKVSSSELLDAIFEECNVELADRIPLL